MRTHLQSIALLVLAAGAWGQTTKPGAPPAAPKAAASASVAANTARAATIGPAAAVITIPGMCDKPPADKAKATECKTVVTRAEFEQLISTIAPSMDPATKKQLATQYGTALVMVHKAHEMGLDQGPRFQELMRVARIGVVTKELSQKLQEDAARIPDQEVETFYQKNQAMFEEVDLQRIFIPRSKQLPDIKEKPDDAAGKDAAKKEQQESEDAMKKLAEALRARAAAGEDFGKLQDEAVAASAFKGKPPTRLGKVRRTSLPADQSEIFNLKSGETSQLITSAPGYLVYKVGEKDTLPLDHVREEIFTALQSQRMQESLQAIQQSATPQLNEKYFGDAPANTAEGHAPNDTVAKPASKAAESGPK